MKIISYNINGIRAFIRKNGLDFIENENPDIFCFQETKISDCKLKDIKIKLQNYKFIYNCSVRKGYAGTMIGIKKQFENDIISIKYNIDNNELNEGRCIILQMKWGYLINVYTPNSGDKLKFKNRRLKWDSLFKDYIKKLQKKSKNIIIVGDMNVARFDTDVYDGKTNKKRKLTAGFTDYERLNNTQLLNDLKLVDIGKKLNKMDFTYYSYRIKTAKKNNLGWRIDYILVSENIQNNISNFKVIKDLTYSDHVPIIFNIKI